MSNGEKLESLIAVVQRLVDHVEDSDLLAAVLRTRIEEQNHRINNLEVLVDNLRVDLKTHNHPYKPEPRYA